jgi:hypothetical protein
MVSDPLAWRRERGVRKHFFFVNKKEAKKTLIHLDRAGPNTPDPD